MSILQGSKKFDDILQINGNVLASSAKSKLTDFVKKHSNSEIGEVVYYFSGHGDFFSNEFYYLMSDYSALARRQTSLENSELDTLIRSLKPCLFVKIVDACHSGTSYIKSPTDFDSYIKSTQGEFRQLYFMFSSQAQEASYQSSNISDFTGAILDAVAGHKSSSIRYKDLIDHVSDFFDGSKSQRPFFVTQADHTDI